MAVAWAWAAPRRTRPASARAPVARPRASRMIDLPAPVSPVSAVKPGPMARSRVSIKTTSRMASPISMVAGSPGFPFGSTAPSHSLARGRARTGRLAGIAVGRHGLLLAEERARRGSRPSSSWAWRAGPNWTVSDAAAGLAWTLVASAAGDSSRTGRCYVAARPAGRPGRLRRWPARRPRSRRWARPDRWSRAAARRWAAAGPIRAARGRRRYGPRAWNMPCDALGSTSGLQALGRSSACRRPRSTRPRREDSCSPAPQRCAWLPRPGRAYR